jgi:hypothetical protein
MNFVTWSIRNPVPGHRACSSASRSRA